jgi:hypothetical protein
VEGDDVGGAEGGFSIASLNCLIREASSSADVIESLLAGFKASGGTGNDGHSTTRIGGLLLQPLNPSSKTIALRHAPLQHSGSRFIVFPHFLFAPVLLDLGIVFRLFGLPGPHGILKTRFD